MSDESDQSGNARGAHPFDPAADGTAVPRVDAGDLGPDPDGAAGGPVLAGTAGRDAAPDTVVESDGTASTRGEREVAVVGAAAAGSARAAARRSGVARAGATPSKGAPTRAREVDRNPRGSWLARLGRFFREVVAELRKVIWPARNQMVTYTIVVIVFVVFMVALVAVLDLLFAKGVLAIFG